MSQIKSEMNKVHFLRNGRVDSDSGKVRTDHAACSYGMAVVQMSDGTVIGPGDMEGGFVSQPSRRDVDLLSRSGFIVVENLGEQFCGPMPSQAGGWAKGKGWH